MPVTKVKGGFKIFSKTGKALSKKPLTKAKAKRQLRAVKMSQGERK
jgi:hypothetical protein